MVSPLYRRLAIYALVVGLATATWQIYIAFSSPGKIDASLVQQLAESGRVDVQIELGFAPEQVHIKLFQQYGAVVGVRNNELTLRRVRAEDVPKIAEYYWVRRLSDAPARSETR